MTAPASEFWSILGVVETVDPTGRKATVSNEEGIIHPITWATGYLDEKFAKLKPGYYRKFSGETGSPGIVTAVGYMGKEEPEWVKARYKALHPQGSGGGKYIPKNDKAIIHEVVYQEMHSTFRQWLEIQTEPLSFEDLMKHADTICDRAKAHAKVLSEAAGV